MFKLAVLGAGLLACAAARAGVETAPVVTFYKDVLPILQQHCQTCHRPGEIAPMPLLTYADARPWAKSIKAAVLNGSMPPWFADSSVGHFGNDRRLTGAEIATIAAWASAGAPAGYRRDAPAPLTFRQGWNIAPDLIVEMPKPVRLPASGTVNYKFILIRTNFPQDLWIRAAEMRPGNPRVVHHGKVWVRPPGSRWMPKAVPGEAYEQETQADLTGLNHSSDRNDILGKFNPGLGAQRYDMDGAAKLVPKGSDLVFELHYTTMGEVAEDASRLGLELAKAPPSARYYLSTDPSANDLKIPPGASNFEIVSEVTVTAPMKLAYVQPHMHLRGKDYELRLIYLSGAVETVFKGKYDFHWQLGYDFARPIPLAKGTRIQGIAHYDNSANNRFNPDPSREVHFGTQNSDEMSNAFIGLILDPKIAPETVIFPSGPSATARSAIGLLFGLLR